MKKKLVMLAIMDGYGITDRIEGNAIKAAKKPNLDYLFATYPNTLLGASGEDVGLPDGQMGNSEVGHLNIGAGRVVYQSLTRVNIAVRNKTLDTVPAINEAIEQAIQKDAKLHIMGLVSDGGVHSHIEHILYLLERSIARGVKEVVVHAFLDGRDVPPRSAIPYLLQLQEKMNELGNSKIGVVSGRYYAMDRDKNYNRVQLAYDAIVYNSGPVKELVQGMNESYANGVSDEFVVPYIVNLDSSIQDNDSVIFANFRPDRAIEMSTAITNVKATGIQNGKQFNGLTFVQMMLYSENVKGLVAFENQELVDIYGEIISKAGLTQLRIAETEKYAHVTYFFDGGIERDLPNATRILIPSPKVATYDMKPEMSAFEVCDQVIKAIDSEEFDTIILNFANCDMVGHTCDFKATVKAVETVDTCMGQIYQHVKAVDGTLIITADHGNADKLLDEEGRPFSAHSTNPVPFIFCKKGVSLRSGGNLGDITPTMLECLGLKQPSAMTGTSLLMKNNTYVVK
ncbi:MAG: 2,3-bisphosphoglycerate-independent phosphoglycerate mutase [Bacilli bacterium]|jgi:2,3-bisphosphoglycerate-independent phosphoglycerate mutase|nr:2,3-bisphosphoglycerate-independent phosphoglycerate mutase [Bacilli bacterium]MDY0064063.1 2,3-bisphosphoglycerate-independent phosphoglycerate mutase [Bacilli bacterium]